MRLLLAALAIAAMAFASGCASTGAGAGFHIPQILEASVSADVPAVAGQPAQTVTVSTTRTPTQKVVEK